jgi:hypothetical protein
MAVKFYDTNALLKLQEDVFDENFIISSITLEELERIKTSGNKSEEVKFKARNIVRLLKAYENSYEVVCYDVAVEKLINNVFLEVTPDTKICACAKYYSENIGDIVFVTDDICCKFFAEHIFGLSTDTVHEENSKGLYLGYKEVEMTEEEMANFFQYPTVNYYDLMVNEYLIIKGLEKDNVYKWTGEKHEAVPVRTFKSKFFKSTIPSASLSPKRLIASLVAFSKLRKQTMLPKVLTELRIRLVRENAWISPCCLRFLSTQRVFSVVASKPVKNMSTTMSKSTWRAFTLADKSL